MTSLSISEKLACPHGRQLMMILVVGLLCGPLAMPRVYATLCQPEIVAKSGTERQITFGITGGGCGGGGGTDPIYYSGSFSGVLSGNVTGVAYLQEMEVDASVTLTGLSADQVTTTENAAGLITQTVSLRYSLVSLSQIVLSNGTVGWKLYEYTKSPYAPDGETGTFEFDGSGALISGNAAELTQISTAIQQADPNTVNAASRALSMMMAGGQIVTRGTGCSTVAIAGIWAAVGIAGAISGNIEVGLAAMAYLSTENKEIKSGLTNCLLE